MIARSLLGLLLCATGGQALAQFSHEADLSLRLDERSEAGFRSQYRFRFEPSYALSPEWSVHSFVATGRSYDSAYNSIGENDDQIHVRRLFARYSGDRARVELGVLPPYKGRVSSTGLSQEGWIKGARVVVGNEPAQLELVVGELGSTGARNALNALEKLNYVEIEYSRQHTDRLSFELGAERMLESSFFRTEVRVAATPSTTLAAELVHNLSDESTKFALSADLTFAAGDRDVDWFTYYAYTPTGFGARAELEEDFLEFGHAVSTEISVPFARIDRLNWFAKGEVYEGQSRAILGVSLSLD